MADNHLSLWATIQSALREEISLTSYETWFANTNLSSINDSALTITVPNTFTKDGLEKRYRPLLEQTVASICGRPMTINFTIKETASVEPTLIVGPEITSREEPLPLNPNYTFAHFVRGSNNHLAYASSIAVAEAPGKAYNPLFIYGSVGLGKTHLLQAIGNHISANKTLPRNVMYTTSERFSIEMISSIRNNTTAAFRAKFRKLDILLIDDIQFLEGKEGTQEELFHTFNELYGQEKQIVFSSDRSPEKLSGLQDRLVSRFRWGLVADIQAPVLETRIAILREKAQLRGIEVDDSIIKLIASRISSNVRALEGALIKAIAYSELQGTHLSVSNLEKILPEEGKRPPLTVEAIKEEVATQYNLKRRDLEGSSRKKELVQARQIAIYIAREMTESSFPSLAKSFGNRDHSTIMHSYIKIKSLLEDTPLLYSEIKEIQENILSKYTTRR
ncbi:chromosomal replication initiator protein DnaA [Candidatus Acetothermia bacterium]|jgi:chromosomal replication initiator protein|nr:chromosomal replication initiator protein DnaA [Candidatus Acetothermia bacterium]MCI2427382.1 chromosomal replication initiator protein DnaA [Candidatus Acetothermia bacterium]MCI2428719.1 chromosomal replication initiator protein DnaA [Candidatus Acetothermia bacterium]